MIFSSLTFLYFFLPVTVVLYFLCKKRVYRNLILLIMSLLFYAWGEPRYILLLLLATLEAYMGGVLIDHAGKAGKLRVQKATLIIAITLLVLNLVIFKYLNFFCDNLSSLIPQLGTIPAIVLPIGISFYTFQTLSYVIDLYRGKVAVQKNFCYLLLYVSFFPQLIAGPIVRYDTVESEICRRHETWDDVAIGLKRFIIGLSKKVLLANTVARTAEIIYAGSPDIYGTAAYWVASLAYTLQIYFDFSGYSDMAIGLGRIFGFHFLENFDYPYISRSITEFWRRWHISLSTWFRDYIYIPLGGNRVSKPRWILNILLVWALTGFWHGANWNFIFWGLYYALLLLLEKLFLGKYLKQFPAILQWLYTFFFVNLGWVLFNLTDFSQLHLALQSMFVYRPTDWLGIVSDNSDILSSVIFLLPAFVLSFPVLKRPLEHIPEHPIGAAVVNVFDFALLLICITCLISASYNPFIYFRF